jgi:ribosomal protein S18 acetylase RimI-like enzyme
VPSDAAGISECILAAGSNGHEQEWSLRSSPAAMEDLLAQTTVMAAVATTSSSNNRMMVLGMILFKRRTIGTVHLSLFFVHPEHQRQGIGIALWEYSLRTNNTQQPLPNTITVNSSPLAVSFYDNKLGFQLNGKSFLKCGAMLTPMIYERLAGESS